MSFKRSSKTLGSDSPAMGYGVAPSTISFSTCDGSSTMKSSMALRKTSFKSLPENLANLHLSLPMRLANSSASACPGMSWSVAITTYGAASMISLAFHTKANFLSSDAETLPSATLMGAPPGTLTTLFKPTSMSVRQSISPSTMMIGSPFLTSSSPKKSCAPPASCVKSFSGNDRYLADTSAPSR